MGRGWFREVKKNASVVARALLWIAPVGAPAVRRFSFNSTHPNTHYEELA